MEKRKSNKLDDREGIPTRQTVLTLDGVRVGWLLALIALSSPAGLIGLILLLG